MGGVSIVTTYALPSAITSVVRILAAFVALFMTAMAFHGHELKKHTGGNADRQKAAEAALSDALMGLFIAIVIAVAAPVIISKAFNLTNLA
jgi:uncharacterized membrane protein